MRRRVPSLDRAKKLLDYRPTRDLAAIVNDVVQEFRTRPAASAP